MGKAVASAAWACKQLVDNEEFDRLLKEYPMFAADVAMAATRRPTPSRYRTTQTLYGEQQVARARVRPARLKARYGGRYKAGFAVGTLGRPVIYEERCLTFRSLHRLQFAPSFSCNFFEAHA
ncbi:uncharacterized protein BDZ99DRAFT_470760 [Mytilinidion resinicola]|uniref:Uncharacterized protein n=1 Tax=Mytilinidion resinicola TaxID=574789 RepID=A0A6A6ZC54_9PEZI|nr:uncharacterized protein BDZ99DRAFT_470760 [Mytilinidion resinicola]KAF2817807.1 hypothetical protein BDZ99DRAFT_470760 [Mytilinidion resinicola]